MTTSGTYSFTVTRDDIINASLRAIGVLAKGNVADATDLTNAGQALNLILKQWADKGAPLWAIQWVNLTLTAGQTSYTVGPSGDFNLLYRPTRVISAYLRDNTIPTAPQDTTLEIISRQEYETLGDKLSQSITNQIYYDAQLPLGVVYTYNVPVDSTHILYMSVQRPIQDVTNGTDNFDLPQEWFLPLKWALAEELGSEYGISEKLQSYVATKASALRENAFNWSVEESSVYFTVDPQSYLFNRG